MPPPTRDHGIMKTAASPNARLRSVDLGAVRWAPGFWASRQQQCREVTLPHLWEKAADPEMGHAWQNLRIAAGLEEGEFAGTHWQDEWIFKWIEAACALLTQEDNAGGAALLRLMMDEVIGVIGAAQEPDGYLATQTQVRGWPRWQDSHHHELYTMGHLITAACLHHRITGQDSLLAIARRAADCIADTFAGDDPALAPFPFNPTIIMAAVELYRTTGERRYLDLARLFVDRRGRHPGGTDQNQNWKPLREETEVVGHAVLFTYLYAGAADVCLEADEPELQAALERLWHDLTERKLYLTGGSGGVHRALSCRWPGDGNWPRATFDVHEAAGLAYELPSATAYNETCAQIGNAMWNWRMLALDPQARYADVMEQCFYNAILSGIGLEGTSWFYTNPLRWYGHDHCLLSSDAHQRFKPGRKHICCPSNLLRLMAELHGYLYSLSDDPGLWLHHYAGSTLDAELPDGTRVKLTQATDYPWDGRVTLTLDLPQPATFALCLRIPGWANGASLTVDGEPAPAPEPGSYARLERTWQPGDVVELSLPMAPRLLQAHPRVEALRGQVAVQRGPLVYCLESPDLPEGVKVSEIRIPADIEWTERHDPALLSGVTVLEGDALRVPEGDWTGRLYRPLQSEAERVRVRLIPYYAWANRGVSEMTVWMPVG